MVIIIVWSTLLLQGSSVSDRQRELRAQNEQEMKNKFQQRAEMKKSLKEMDTEDFNNEEVLAWLRELLNSQDDEAKALNELAQEHASRHRETYN
jgi:hypothetical protein